ncbi:unnamed protein product [Paramecium sonneborni]|uniref:G domain-containing protein n=1 Tax=Paramecium sonneborni TaxID=65129 RepID=A0A8S1P0U1_9CILI|nr:unnamed protein product [Paramecium sonneborni]
MQQSNDVKYQDLIEKGQEIIKEIINEVEKDFEKFLEFTEKHTKKEIIILCGNTGAGKSTIYNWLLGAQFQITRNSLQIKQANQEFKISPQSSSSISVTQNPFYEYIQEFDHILVDFPGFESTKSENHQLYVDLLFKKITNAFETKIVYVLENTKFNLTQRGKDYQSFIIDKIQSDTKNVENVCLILNQYNDRPSDDEFIQNVKDILEKRRELKNLPKSICVIRQIQNDNDINEILSEEKRYNKNYFKTYQFSQIIRRLNHKRLSKCYELILFYKFNKYGKLNQNDDKLKKNIDNIIMIESGGQIESFNIQEIKKLFNLYKTMIQTCNNYNEIFDKDFNIFEKIYNYFEPFNPMMKCFDQIQQQLKNEQSNLDTINQLIKKSQENNKEIQMKRDQIAIHINDTKEGSEGSSILEIFGWGIGLGIGFVALVGGILIVFFKK